MEDLRAPTKCYCSCLPEYMHPTEGPLNLATMLPSDMKAPDLGPKVYIAYGQEREHEGEGDSVTKLHLDLSDAINILVHVQHPKSGKPAKVRYGEKKWETPGYDGAGAVWDMVRREDMPAFRRVLEDIVAAKVPGCPLFRHAGEVVTPVTVVDVVHGQSLMLTEPHRAALRSHGIHPWHFEQYEWEGVVIPAGCGHDVRNLRSCTKVALDFVSPQSVQQCMQLRQEMRALSVQQAAEWTDPTASGCLFQDKLQLNNMLLYAMISKLRVIETHHMSGKRR
jgi:lysine-specific demethylase 3